MTRDEYKQAQRKLNDQARALKIKYQIQQLQAELRRLEPPKTIVAIDPGFNGPSGFAIYPADWSRTDD